MTRLLRRTLLSILPVVVLATLVGAAVAPKAVAAVATAHSATCVGVSATLSGFPDGTNTITIQIAGDPAVTRTFAGTAGSVSATWGQLGIDVLLGGTYSYTISWTANGGGSVADSFDVTGCAGTVVSAVRHCVTPTKATLQVQINTTTTDELAIILVSPPYVVINQDPDQVVTIASRPAGQTGIFAVTVPFDVPPDLGVTGSWELLELLPGGGGTGRAQGSLPVPKISDCVPSTPMIHLSLSASTASPGGTVTIHATGLTPNAKVTITLHSAPVVLAELAAASDGSLTTAVAIPADTPVGPHTITISQTSGGVTTSAQAALTVVVNQASAANAVTTTPALTG